MFVSSAPDVKSRRPKSALQQSGTASGFGQTKPRLGDILICVPKHRVDGTMRKQRPNHHGADSHDRDARAQEALDEARKLPHGPARTEAMKKAGRLRVAADMKQPPNTKLVKPVDSC
jgi:hypothetical protein